VNAAVKIALDTNICIAILNDSSAAARARVSQFAPAEVAISSIVLFELYFGAHKSSRAQANLRVLKSFVSRVTVLDFSEEDAAEAGRLRAHLQSLGQPIGPFDVLIAAQAKARSLPLATNNVREFARVPELKIEDWLLVP
jgi:tRNA(fMet)-specific endonuclease VapC